VVLLLKGEDTSDSSKSNFTMTASSGDASVSTTQKKFGSSSLRFINRGRYTLANSQSNQAFNFGTADYTIDFWLYAVGKSVANNIVGQGNWTKTSGNRWWLNYNATTEWKFMREGNASPFPGSGVKTLNLNQWYHFALVRSAGVLKLYKDGVLEWNIGSDTTAYSFTGYPLTVGNDFNGTSYDNNCFLDHLRITKGVARYTTTFTPPTENDY